MPQTMLRLKTGTPSGDAPKTTAHLLPCRVHHNGSVEPAQPFWQPSSGPGTTPRPWAESAEEKKKKEEMKKK